MLANEASYDGGVLGVVL